MLLIKFLGLSDVIFRHSLMKALPEVKEANSYMVKAREIEQELRLSPSIRGHMECDMVEYVLNKMDEEDKKRGESEEDPKSEEEKSKRH